MFDFDQPKTIIVTTVSVLLFVVVITFFFAWMGSQIKAQLFSWFTQPTPTVQATIKPAL